MNYLFINKDNDPIPIIIDKFTKLNEEIRKYLPGLSADDYSLTLITVGKIVDAIFNANLENIINTTTNNYAYRYIKPDRDLVGGVYNVIGLTTYNKISITDINMDKLIKDVLKIYKKHSNLQLFHYADELMKKNPYNKNVYKITGMSINDEPNQNYMEFNSELLDLLLLKGANVNIRDKDGNIPINIAILQSNLEAIKKLLKANNSVKSKKSKNRFGLTPFDTAKKVLLSNIDNFMGEIDKKNIDGIIKETNDDILKITKINHIMRYHDVCIKMLLYIINHYLFNKINNYDINIKKKLHDYLFKDIKINKLPLIDIDNSNFMSHFDVIDKTFKDKKDDIAKKINEHFKIISIKNNLDTEKDASGTTKFRKDEIDNIRNNLDIEEDVSGKTKLLSTGELNELNNDDNFIDIIKQENYNTNKRRTNRIRNNILFNSSKNPLETYNNLFEKFNTIGEADYKTYIILWDILLKKDIYSDPTQFIYNVFNKIKNNIDNYDEIKLYNDVFSLLSNNIDTYFTLSPNYNDANIELDNIIDIISHITKHSMLVNLYSVIVKLLYSELTSIYPEKTNDRNYYTDINKRIFDILTNDINGVNIKDYIFNTLPEKIVKISLGIFEDDEDDDKNTSIMNLLSRIDKILLASTQPSFTSESSTIKLLTKNIYPYFKTYLEVNIKKLKKIADAYYGMIINLSSKLTIYQLVLKKSKSE